MDTIEPIRNCLFDLCHPVDTLTTHCSKLGGKILQNLSHHNHHFFDFNCPERKNPQIILFDLTQLAQQKFEKSDVSSTALTLDSLIKHSLTSIIKWSSRNKMTAKIYPHFLDGLWSSVEWLQWPNCFSELWKWKSRYKKEGVNKSIHKWMVLKTFQPKTFWLVLYDIIDDRGAANTISIFPPAFLVTFLSIKSTAMLIAWDSPTLLRKF